MIAALFCPPPNALVITCACSVAVMPESVRCVFKSVSAPISPVLPRILSPSAVDDRPMELSAFAASADGAPIRARVIRRRVAASCAGTPSSVMVARAAPTDCRLTPNVFAAGRMPVEIAPTRSVICMLPAPMIALTVAAVCENVWAPLIPDRHAPARALVVSSRLDPPTAARSDEVFSAFIASALSRPTDFRWYSASASACGPCWVDGASARTLLVSESTSFCDPPAWVWIFSMADWKSVAMSIDFLATATAPAATAREAASTAAPSAVTREAILSALLLADLKAEEALSRPIRS